MGKKEYIALCAQVITTASGFKTMYWSDDKRFSARKQAIKNGFEIRGSDDFNIGVLEDGKLVSLDWMDEPVDTDPDILAEIQEEGWA